MNRICALAEFSVKYYIRGPTHIQANGKQTRPTEFKEDEELHQPTISMYRTLNTQKLCRLLKTPVKHPFGSLYCTTLRE